MNTKNNAHITFVTSPIKAIYTVFLAFLVALFFGFGVAAFYPAPKAPEFPPSLQVYEKTSPEQTVQTEEMKATQIKYDNEQRDFQKKIEVYSRNVSVITLVLAILALVISLTVVSNIELISDGLLFGGLLTLLYSIIRGFASSDVKYSFVVVSAGLLIAVILGYIKFIKPQTEKEDNKVS